MNYRTYFAQQETIFMGVVVSTQMQQIDTANKGRRDDDAADCLTSFTYYAQYIKEYYRNGGSLDNHNNVSELLKINSVPASALTLQ